MFCLRLTYCQGAAPQTWRLTEMVGFIFCKLRCSSTNVEADQNVTFYVSWTIFCFLKTTMEWHVPCCIIAKIFFACFLAKHHPCSCFIQITLHSKIHAFIFTPPPKLRTNIQRTIRSCCEDCLNTWPFENAMSQSEISNVKDTRTNTMSDLELKSKKCLVWD